MKSHSVWLKFTLFIALIFLGQYGASFGFEPNNTNAQYRVQLPMLNNNVLIRDVPSTPTIFGVEAGANRVSNQLYRGAETNAYWLRNNAYAILWSDVEQTEGARDWNAPSMRAAEQHMLLAAQHGFQLIQIVRGTPQWARKYPGQGASCGPIDQQKYRAFASFMRDVVLRYSAPPFNIKHWEIWNEPDAPALTGDSANEVFGCWGELNVDPYYSFGGRHFGFMLQNVYPAIKSADPQSKVILGGLLLSCHPTFAKGNDSVCAQISAGFLEGVFIGGGGPYFDILGIHAYDIWFGGARYQNEQWYSSVEGTGPSLVAKTDYVRGVLAKYGFANKPIMNTEYALICWQCKTAPPEFELAKANYLVQANVAAIAKGLLANIWYSVEGWGTHQTQLLDGASNPTQAYVALQLAVDRLGAATFTRIEPSNPNVKIYAFQRADRKLWVAWASNGQPTTISLPELPYSVIDLLGNRIEPSQNLKITSNSIYIEFAPPTPTPTQTPIPTETPIPTPTAVPEIPTETPTP